MPNEQGKWYKHADLPTRLKDTLCMLAKEYDMSAKHGGPLCYVRLKPPALESLVDPLVIERLDQCHDCRITADVDDGLLMEIWFDKVGITL